MNKLQNTLNLRVQQKQILTPGLVQMVTVLALNKVELKDMITAEMVENPVLDELETSVPSIEEIAGREEKRDRESSAVEVATPTKEEASPDPFENVDFGSFFRDYLDPGHRTHMEMEDLEKPSFENFLSQPATLTDHLVWQLGSLSLSSEVREACTRIIGNLNEEGYLIATDDELRELATAQEALARFAWEPYLHNPLLPHRLHRLRVPTLIIHGTVDRLVRSPDYYERFAALLGGPTTVVAVDRGGHRVDEEHPIVVAAAVRDFVAQER